MPLVLSVVPGASRPAYCLPWAARHGLGGEVPLDGGTAPQGYLKAGLRPFRAGGVRFRDRDSCAAAPPLRDRRINGIAFSVSVLGARPRLPVPVMNALSLQWNHGSSFRHAAMGSRPRLSVMPSCAAVRSSIMPAVMRGPSLVVPYPGRLSSGRGRKARRAVVGGGRLLPATLAGP